MLNVPQCSMQTHHNRVLLTLLLILLFKASQENRPWICSISKTSLYDSWKSLGIQDKDKVFLWIYLQLLLTWLLVTAPYLKITIPTTTILPKIILVFLVFSNKKAAKYVSFVIERDLPTGRIDKYIIVVDIFQPLS